MSKLLLGKDSVIMFSRELACIKGIGLNGAILLQQIHYWIEQNKASYLKGESSHVNCYQDGKFWVYNSVDAWKAENFPFWSEKTIIRTRDNLVKDGFLILGNYNLKGYDRTKWYTINYEKLEEIEDQLEELFQYREEKKIEKIQKKNEAKKKEEEQRKLSEKSTQTVENTHLDKLSKCDEHSFGQNDQSIWTDCPVHMDNMTKPIPKITTEITTEITSSSSITLPAECESEEEIEEIISLIEQGTGLLLSPNMKKTVRKWKYKDRVEKSIEIFKEKGGKYFSLLERIYNSNQNFTPKAAAKTETDTYQQPTYYKNNGNNLRFNNFEAREYDYDALERKLLGWD